MNRNSKKSVLLVFLSFFFAKMFLENKAKKETETK